MELDDLRRSWQAQPTGSLPAPATTEQGIQAVLTERTEGPIAQLKRNIQRDMKLGIFVLLLNFYNVLNLITRQDITIESRYMIMGVVVLLLVLLALSMRRRLQLVRQLETSSADLYSQLKTNSRKLRQLLQTDRLMGVGMMLLVLAVFLYKMHTKLLAYLNPEVERWGSNVTVFVLGCIGLVLFVTAVLALSEHKQQQRYGQYLDQLDAAVHEFDELRDRP